MRKFYHITLKQSTFFDNNILYAILIILLRATSKIVNYILELNPSIVGNRHLQLQIRVKQQRDVLKDFIVPINFAMATEKLQLYYVKKCGSIIKSSISFQNMVGNVTWKWKNGNEQDNLTLPQRIYWIVILKQPHNQRHYHEHVP